MPAVRVRLVIDGVRLEFRGDEALFERSVSALVEEAYRGKWGPRGDAAEPTDPPAPAVAAPAEDADPSPDRAEPGFTPQSTKFSSFLRQVGERAATPAQQVTAFAFYLWNYEDRRQFGSEEIEGCFRAVGMQPPEPLGACLADLCERKRFLAPVEGNGQLELTPKGVNYVKTRLLSAL